MWDEREIMCLFQAIIILPILIYQLQKFRGDKVTTKVFVFVCANFCLQISAFLILPLDIITAKDGEEAFFLKIYWYLFYWINFFFGNFILPFCMYYYQSSEFTKRGMIRQAMRNMVIWTFGPLMIGILFWLWLLFKGHITIMNTPKIVIALSNAYGMIVLICALSYGLIRVPMQAWENRDLKIILGYHYFMTKAHHEAKKESIYSLEVQYSILTELKNKVEKVITADDPRPQVLEKMQESIPISILKHLEMNLGLNKDYMRSKYLKKQFVTMQDLVDFNYYLKSAIWDYEMCDHLYDKNLINVYYYSRIQECIEQGDKFVEDKFTPFKQRELLFKIIPGFEYSWYRRWQKLFAFVMLIVLTGLSALVFLGELHMYFQFAFVANCLDSILYFGGTYQLYVIFFFVLIFFGYMIYVSCYSIFSIKIFGFYGFYPHKTDPLTYLTFVYHMSKLTYPLCYTTLYILLGRSHHLEDTGFYRSIGNLKVIPVLGYDLPTYLPFLFFLLVILFLFDCFGKVLKPFGFEFYDYKLESKSAQVEDGQRIATEHRNLFYEELLEKEREQAKGGKVVILAERMLLL